MLCCSKNLPARRSSKLKCVHEDWPTTVWIGNVLNVHDDNIA